MFFKQPKLLYIKLYSKIVFKEIMKNNSFLTIIKKKIFHAQAYKNIVLKKKLTYYFGMILIRRHQILPLYLEAQ